MAVDVSTPVFFGPPCSPAIFCEKWLTKLHDHMDDGKKRNATDNSTPEHIRFVSRSIDLIIAFKREAASLNLHERNFPAEQHVPDRYGNLFIWELQFANPFSLIGHLVSLVHMVSSKLRLRENGVLPWPSDAFRAEGRELLKRMEEDGYSVFRR
ncbi:hypothetical protein HII31_04769 [Pseudocercospora fuligena]|uniref:Uncharacterized protein n=1 Tax=Pseudocercospora fuligena TaxID=685502 RepID=A0A8H6RMR2_9PEZI|nr:hypothetical protein HII31_04769 [Pseudocercospora fuligena]